MVHGYACRWNETIPAKPDCGAHKFAPGAFILDTPVQLIRQYAAAQVIGSTEDGSLKLTNNAHGLLFEWHPTESAVAWRTFEDVESFRLNGLCIGWAALERNHDTIRRAIIRFITICDFGCCPGTGCIAARAATETFRSHPTQGPDGRIVWSGATLQQYTDTRGDGAGGIRPLP